MTDIQGDFDMAKDRIKDTHRRIRNILDVCPAVDWTLDESQAVLRCLAGILWAHLADLAT